MLSLTPIIKLLQDKPAEFNQQWFRQVAGAAEYAQIRPEALPLPACWVVRSADKSAHAGERAELVTIAFDAVIAIENVRMHADGDTDDMLLAYRIAVKNMLLWYQMAEEHPIKFDGGRVLEYADGSLYWADRYVFETVMTNYLPDPPNFERVQHTGATL